ncbi:MAG: hypothetical protein ACOC2H_00075 [Spirochaetota bacterium]
MKIISKIEAYRNSLKQDSRKRNRFFLLLVTAIIIADYLMICYHINKNPFAVFPSLPVRDTRESVDIYVPDIDGSTLLKETRLVQKDASKESLIRQLVFMISRGSMYENTRITVPIECIVRTVWVEDGLCIIDIRMMPLGKDIPIIEGSESNFREAVRKTVIENIGTIKDVIIVENGIFNRDMWELSRVHDNEG